MLFEGEAKARERLVDRLQVGISDADLQAIHKALARLRLAFEEHKP